MSDAEIGELVARVYRDTGGDLAAAHRAVYEAGRMFSGGRSVEKRRAWKAASERKGAKRAGVAGEFLRRRWARVFKAVAERNGTTVDRLLYRTHAGGTEAERRGIEDLCWTLRQVTGLGFMSLGGMLERHHSSVIAACQRMEARIAARPELREELLAMVGERGRKEVAA